ncbi:polysialyltransferase family glycosyltransferase [Priestia megaterium]|uniref:polysialyltransferase family glycosyltransferase n=1 Tax=Priestia megaterium TaxID=1404 RepID=UPI00119ED11E|nr:polysialyltransferase family glycosyltransferase [Priestia megaterium]
MRLFSISSPLLFYFAQSVAYEFEDKKNIALLWHVKGCENHLESYNLMYEKKVWKDKILFTNARHYNEVTLSKIIKFSETRQYLNNVEYKLIQILNENYISEVFIGNRHAPFDRMIWEICRQKNIQVHILEDGLTNYLNFKYYESEKMNIFTQEFIKSMLKNVFFKLIDKNQIYSSKFDLVFEDVYSVFPNKYLNNNYKGRVRSIKLENELKLSNVEDLLNKDPVCNKVNFSTKENILFLSQSLSEDGLVDVSEEISILTSYLQKIDYKKYTIIIKPHPRDRIEKINKMMEVVEKNGGEIILFNSQIPLPIEIIIKKLKVEEVWGFWSAALFYLSEISPHLKVKSLLPLMINDANNTNQKLKRIFQSIQSVFPTEVIWLDY